MFQLANYALTVLLASNTHALASSFVPSPFLHPFFPPLHLHTPEHEKDTRFSSPCTPGRFQRTRPNDLPTRGKKAQTYVLLSLLFLSDVTHEGVSCERGGVFVDLEKQLLWTYSNIILLINIFLPCN